MGRNVIRKGEGWCVVGFNRLTQQYEVLTPSLRKETATAIREKEMSKRARKRAYIRLKVDRRENYPPFYNSLFSGAKNKRQDDSAVKVAPKREPKAKEMDIF